MYANIFTWFNYSSLRFFQLFATISIFLGGDDWWIKCKKTEQFSDWRDSENYKRNLRQMDKAQKTFQLLSINCN